MFGAAIDSGAFVRRLTDLERKALPGIALRSLNDAAFEVRAAWRERIPYVFDRPTQLTLSAPLYRKATPQKLEAEVYIRDEATKGTPPAKYLAPQVFGGERRQKAHELLLERNAGLMPFFVPSRQAQRDQHGNIRTREITKILSQMRANRLGDQRESDRTRASRLRRQRKRGGGGSYFVLRQRHGRLQPHVIFERIDTAFGSAVRPVLVGKRSAPSYRARYDVFALAQQIFGARFARNFRARLTTLTRGRL